MNKKYQGYGDDHDRRGGDRERSKRERRERGRYDKREIIECNEFMDTGSHKRGDIYKFTHVSRGVSSGQNRPPGRNGREYSGWGGQSGNIFGTKPAHSTVIPG